jgi:hypothetical protein
MGRVCLIACLGALLLYPSMGFAAVLVPPGKSGASQYYETIPTSQGGASPPGSGPHTSSPSGALSKIGQGRAGSTGLSRLGKNGQAAAALAKATAPAVGGDPAAGSGKSSRGAAGSAASSADTRTSSSRLAPLAGQASSSHTGSAGSAVADALAGSGGLGVLLPALMGASLVAAAAIGMWRIRRRPGSTA